MLAEQWKPLVEALSYVGGAVAGLGAWRVYRQNSQLERAKWITALCEKFFEADALKPVREKLDDEEPDSAVITGLIEAQPSNFTDYLNFFEFVAILKHSGQMTDKDVQDLFDYYLRSLKKHNQVTAYVHDKKNGFEHLRRLLDCF